MTTWLILAIGATALLIWLVSRGHTPRMPGNKPPSSAARFVSASGPGDVDRWLSNSQEAPVWIYLHDPHCPISRAALKQVERTALEFELVDVSLQQPISRALEARTGVRHESPQVLLLRGGRASWSASHYGITESTIANAAQDIKT